MKFFDTHKFHIAILVVALFSTLVVTAGNYIGVAEFELVVEAEDSPILQLDRVSPIVVDPAWFGSHEEDEFRVKVQDESDNVVYLQCKLGAYWETPSVGTYKLTLQKKIGEEWVSTEYTRTIEVNGLRKMTAEDIELDIPSIKTTNILESVCSLDICTGTRLAHFPEKITYDENWFSSTGAGYIRIMENGTRVAQENGAGEYSWTVTEGGIYTLTHRTYIDGCLQNDKIYTATFIVEDVSVLKNVVASQRYPWNGLVDIKCILEGDGARDYKVALEVKDETGGTNLPARTFWQNGGGVTNSVQIARPGDLHFIWDANADIAEDGEFPAVSITVKAEPIVAITETKMLEEK